MKYVSLHTHSEYSLLDGASSTESLLKRTKEISQESLCITDHGNLFNYLNFISAAKKEGIRPILGVELYMSENRLIKQDVLGKREKLNHLTVICKNQEGYKNLIKLVIETWEAFYYKPRA